MKFPPTLKTEARDEAYEYFDIHIRKLTKTKDGKVDPTALGLEDNDIDAFRHAYVSGVFTQEYSESAADIFGQLNEYISFGSSSSNQERATNMDLWNNSVGRKYGKQTKDRKTLLKKIHEALKNGELIIDLKDTRQYHGAQLGPTSKKSVIVLKEDKNGRNIVFFDLNRQEMLPLDEFVTAIQSGQYPSYGLKTVSGKLTPFSKPDGSSQNNLG